MPIKKQPDISPSGKKTHKAGRKSSPNGNKTRRAKLKIQQEPSSMPTAQVEATPIVPVEATPTVPVEATPTAQVESKSIIETIVSAFSGTTNTAVPQQPEFTCETTRCPSGYRCGDDKKCYRLTELEIVSDGKRLILSVDGQRKKKYDIDMLSRNFDRIRHLQSGRIDGKSITGTTLKRIINDLKQQVEGDTRSSYYGTLNDEMIIQIIHLENQIHTSTHTETEDNEPVSKQSIDIASTMSPEINIDKKASPDPENIEDVVADEDVDEDNDIEWNKEMYKIPSLDIESSEKEKALQDKIGVAPTDVESKEYNKYMLQKEQTERQDLQLEDTYDFLYPDLNDPNFNVKIANRKEFNDTQYDGEIYDIKTQAEKMCNVEFELMPHQLFVKNFLSFQTPYNSLLLYHGLGTGKTCSAIGIAEEMRSYMKQTGITQRIMVIASPNVQNNFRLQIFDEKKLKQDNGIWNINTCIGNTLLNEINPSQIQDMPREKVISQINNLISQYYIFMGYGELANYIKRKITVDSAGGLSTKQQKLQEIGNIQSLFNNRLVIIDEVHNIRVMQDNKEAKKTANLLMKVCKYAENMRLLLLSATPIFNDYREIIWLTNLLNAVDKRGLIEETDVFTSSGEFTEPSTLPDGTLIEGGEELLRRKLTGYVSYVRGENPYTFPYRIYPVDFSTGRQMLVENYPSVQMNNKPIEEKPSKTPIYMDRVGDYQKNAYEFVINHLLQVSFSTTDNYGKTRDMPDFENMESFGYTHLREPLQSLNIIFPSPEFDKIQDIPASPGEDVAIEEPNEPVVSENESPVESQAAKEFDEDENEEKISGGNKNDSTGEPSVGAEENGSDDDAKESGSDDDTEESGSDDDAEESGSDDDAAESGSDDDAEESGSDDDTEESGSDDDDDDAEENEVDEEILQRDTNIINSMIGKEGLSNTMTYVEQRTPTELRYNFAYKPTVLEKYGRIFHPDNLEKYSGKIASICDSIKNSNGIIMVYSQFIDGGVVPIALALEEMGFTRYGSASHTKSLFETPPTEQVDSSTFKTLSNMEDKSRFHAAKYVMITGDKMFSPNNLADLKYITDPANKNGELVRVVLITKAAAEGLDFKNIRQLHILEPWYNMNRAEQIIGRGVRNLSHCMLPFEERNVEIYLHASTPVDEKETADLYVYRYAENKAIQIGKITRILKENAIDCILNIGQTSFTIDKLNAIAENQQIQLKLSSNQEIDYKIGDREGSAICDYMNCDFVCSPNTTIEPTDINQTTYGEHFVKMNYNAIAKRIRDVFREQTFFKRDQLIASIQIMKNYPQEQIDYVLSMFVDNSQNYIVDKYGRNGYLVNTGEYYGFQPVEITNEHISIFDRSAPVDYKPAEMYMELPTKKEDVATESPKVLDIEQPLLPNIGKLEKTYQSLMNELNSALKTVDGEKENYKKGILMETAEVEWYKHMGHVYDELENRINIPVDMIQKYIVYHWLDTQSLNDKLVMLYQLYKVEPYTPTSPIEYIIQSYFNEKILIQKGEKSIALGGNNHIDLYVHVAETRKWKKATPTIVRKYQDKLREKYTIESSKIQPFVGFMHLFKKNEMTFKMKEIVKSGATSGKGKTVNKGFKCSVMGKNEIVKFMNNKVLAKNPYPVLQDKGGIIKYDVNKNAKNIMRMGLCVMMELIMRYFNDSPISGNLKWFFNVEETLANDLPKL